MKTIKIHGTKIELFRIDKLSEIESLKFRKYKLIIDTSIYDPNKVFDLDSFNNNVIINNYKKLSEWIKEAKKNTEIWVIGDSKERWDINPSEYSREDLITLLSFYESLIENKLDLALLESIIWSINDTKMIEDFYRSVNITDSNYKEFKLKLVGSLDNYEKFKSSITDIRENFKFKLQYQPTKRYNYSIKKLLIDLVNDKSSISIDKEIIGCDYEVITGSELIDYSKYESKGISVNWGGYFKWEKVNKIQFNNNRANLSLVTNKIVELVYPDQKVKKVSSIRSTCVILDGKVHLPKLAVKVSDSLKKKLSCVPELIDIELFESNELLLDLTKLPTITLSDLNQVTEFQLSYMQMKKEILGLKKYYIKYLTPKVSKPKITPKSPIKKSEIFDKITDTRREYYEISGHLKMESSITSLLSLRKSQIKQGNYLSVFSSNFKLDRNNLKEELTKTEEEIRVLSSSLSELKFSLLMSKYAKFKFDKNYFQSRTIDLSIFGVKGKVLVKWIISKSVGHKTIKIN